MRGGEPWEPPVLGNTRPGSPPLAGPLHGSLRHQRAQGSFLEHVLSVSTHPWGPILPPTPAQLHTGPPAPAFQVCVHAVLTRKPAQPVTSALPPPPPGRAPTLPLHTSYRGHQEMDPEPALLTPLPKPTIWAILPILRQHLLNLFLCLSFAPHSSRTVL